MKLRHFSIWLLVAFLPACAPATLWAAFGEDIEKPKPEFTREDGDWVARFVPRGKSNAIRVRFQLDGGQIREAAAMEFAPAEQPDVDNKNFRSDFFKVRADVPTGGEAALSLSSDYFTSATELWGPQTTGGAQWGSMGAVTADRADLVKMLTVTIKDGGPLDADGQADGRILVIFGPRDSFWGYALGTLFIRFFGIFLVLAILMMGMNFSGWVFRRIDRGKETSPASGVGAVDHTEAIVAETAGVSAETAAAIAVALHLHATGSAAVNTPQSPQQSASPWSLDGRARLMGDRLPVFDRLKRK
ncbi:MAG: hypothetical protein VR64_10990 [Desulfatitalea sp. BRH_c12]|nr:MAG: hypothetical protein VR64_10990 [Desulfatitalea sp. BRH_c12]